MWGYSRCARYCLSDKSSYQLQTWSGGLASRLNFLQTTNMECWLEASTEQSESNPGRSLGTITMKRRAVWKTVPHDKLIANIMNYIAPSPYGSVRTRSKRSRITPMRRILSFTDLIISCVTTWYWIYYGLHLRLYGAGLPPARDNPW